MTLENSMVIHRLYDQYMQKKAKIFLLLSANKNAGVTYCCKKIAKSASRLLPDIKTIIVDMNIYNPVLSKAAGNPAKGWISCLIDQPDFELKDAVLPIPDMDNVKLLPAGDTSQYNMIALERHRNSLIFDILKKDFDLILVDSPSYYQGPEAGILCKTADSTIITVEAEVTRRPMVKQMIAEVRELNDSILGILFNKRKFHIPQWVYSRFF